MFDLLADPLIRTDLRSGRRAALSLPEVYRAMMADDVTGFPALRPHQRHAWHAFLAQLGAIAVYHGELHEPPRGAGHWQYLLEELTDGFPGQTPWHLIVGLPTQPAFMQCPAPDGLASYKKERVAADDLDLLVTAKNHDVKSSVAVGGEVDDWVFSLVSIQTMSGFGGAGNYGIARMNGGFSSRPCLGLAPANGGPGAHLQHDMRGLLEHREPLLQSHEDYFDADSGLVLLWTVPWDGTSSLRLDQLDPHFIEVCRRVRLLRRDGRIVARTAPSKKPRIAAKHARGDVGDHWTPVDRGDRKALSISRVGFRYDRLAELVLDDTKYQRPPAMEVDGTVGCSWRLVARGIAAGQGKTEGYYERSDIMLRPRVARSLMGVGSSRQRLGELSRDQLAEIQAVAKALRFAIAIAASGGSDEAVSGSDREKAYPYLRRFDATVDVHFFEALQHRFEAAEEDLPAARREFLGLLVNRAKSLLGEAVATLPCASIQRYRARTRAMSAFWGSLWRSDVIDQAILDNTHGEEKHVS